MLTLPEKSQSRDTESLVRLQRDNDSGEHHPGRVQSGLQFGEGADPGAVSRPFGLISPCGYMDGKVRGL